MGLNYRLRNTDVLGEDKNVFYQTDLRILPCSNYLKTGGVGETCCSDMNIVGCQDHPNDVIGGTDLQIAYFQNSHIPTCAGTPFTMDPNCGSTIEIHHKDRHTPIVADVRISNDLPDGYQTTYISTAELCVGNYELWFVVRTRSGPFIKIRKDFVVKDPSCYEPDSSHLGLLPQQTDDSVGSMGILVGSRKLSAEGANRETNREVNRENASFDARLKENRKAGWVTGTREWDDRIEKRRRQLRSGNDTFVTLY